MNSFWQMHKIFAGLLAKPRPNPQSTMGNWQFLGPTPKKLWIPYNAVDKYGISTIHSTRQTYLQSVSQLGGQAGEWVARAIRLKSYPSTPRQSNSGHTNPAQSNRTQLNATQPARQTQKRTRDSLSVPARAHSCSRENSHCNKKILISFLVFV